MSIRDVELDSPGWDGAVNLWQVRPGLYRMGRQEWLSQQGWDDLAQEVGTAVDLRLAKELGAREGEDASVKPPEKLRMLHRPVEDPDDAPFWAAYDSYPNHPRFYQHTVASFPHLVGKALANTLEAWITGGVVVNCSAGRDRTGLVVAMLLNTDRAPGGRADWAEQAAVYRAGVLGINEYRKIADRPHPVERLILDADLEDHIAERLVTLQEFLGQWPAEKINRLMDQYG